jgi:hypothetical protein
MNPSSISPKILSKYSVETINKINYIFLKRHNLEPPILRRQSHHVVLVNHFYSNSNSPIISRVNSPSILEILDKFK